MDSAVSTTIGRRFTDTSARFEGIRQPPRPAPVANGFGCPRRRLRSAAKPRLQPWELLPIGSQKPTFPKSLFFAAIPCQAGPFMGRACTYKRLARRRPPHGASLVRISGRPSIQTRQTPAWPRRRGVAVRAVSCPPLIDMLVNLLKLDAVRPLIDALRSENVIVRRANACEIDER
jgi:hypothetical protein